MNKMRGMFLLAFSIGVIFYITNYSSAKTGEEYADIVINSKYRSMRAAGVKDVLFPHWFHRIRFKCKVCHEDIFILRAGSNDIDMNQIMNGEKCGRCHNGIVAWEPIFCERCHSKEPGWTPGPIQHSKKRKMKDEERQKYMDGGKMPWE